MSPSVLHKKIFPIGITAVLIGALFSVIIPMSASAALTNEIPGPTLHYCALVKPPTGPDIVQCYREAMTGLPESRCTSKVNDLLSSGQILSVTAPCYDVLDPNTSASLATQKQMVQAVTQTIQKRDQDAADSIFPSWIPNWMLAPIAAIAWIIFKIAGFFLISMAKIMDIAIGVTINSNVLNNLQFVNIGWTAVRDFSNMFFIFALLYIAIQTILGLAGGGAKRWLVHLIIAALLINFSLFMTKVVIDAGNIVAVAIWDKISTEQTPGTTGASPKILGGLQLQTMFDKAGVENMKNGSKIFIYGGGAVFMFIAGYILLAGALMMITRTIMLIILMIFSPFAFMSFGLPKLEQYGHRWLDKLISQTFVAPFFIFMLYLNAVMVDHLDLFRLSGAQGINGGSGASFANALTGGSDFAIIFNYIMMIGFLVASLAIANSVAGEVGSSARGWARAATKWAGGAATGAAVGTGAFAMRQSLGKIGMMSKDNEKLREQAAKGGVAGAVARGKIAMYSGMAKATYDPRATKLGQTALSGGGKINIGKAAGVGGFAATGSALSKATLGSYGYTGSAHDKEVLAIAEERYKNDPKGKEAYLRANLGTMTKTKIDEETGKKVVTERFVKRYDEAADFKGQRQAVSREIAAAEAKKNLRDNITAYKEAEKNGELKKLNAEGKEIGKAAADIIKESLKALTGKEAADMLNNEQLQLAPVIAALNNQHLVALTQRVDLEPKTIEAITQGVITNGTTSGQNYLRSQTRIGGMFQYDAEKELERLTSAYDAQKIALAGKSAEWAAFQKQNQSDIGKTLGMVGGAKEIAELDDSLIAHEALVSQYNSKVVREFEKRIKEGVMNGDFATKLSGILQAQARGATKTASLSNPTQAGTETPLPTIDPNYRPS